MKKITIFALITLLFFRGKAQTKNFIDQPYIEVSGNADTLITPDEIYIKITLSEKDTRDKVSLEEMENKLYTGLKNLGINTEDHLKAIDISSNFKSYLLKAKDILKTKNYMLQVGNADTASKVFFMLENNDISNTFVDHVSYSNTEAIKNILRIKAIKNAQESAESFTKPLNQNIGKAIYISAVNNGDVYNALAGKVAGIMLNDVITVGYGAINKNELPKIDFEKIKYSTNVNVKFILN